MFKSRNANRFASHFTRVSLQQQHLHKKDNHFLEFHQIQFFTSHPDNGCRLCADVCGVLRRVSGGGGGVMREKQMVGCYVRCYRFVYTCKYIFSALVGLYAQWRNRSQPKSNDKWVVWGSFCASENVLSSIRYVFASVCFPPLPRQIAVNGVECCSGNGQKHVGKEEGLLAWLVFASGICVSRRGNDGITLRYIFIRISVDDWMRGPWCKHKEGGGQAPDMVLHDKRSQMM